ncbi:cytochrome P450 [Gorgonomyces haynaldii]|nr:cytochrome P450 [Gorgonomyces haynaldii]KAI8914237.1 cytochrome P450 [Gorgonomyces haynaldii]
MFLEILALSLVGFLLFYRWVTTDPYPALKGRTGHWLFGILLETLEYKKRKKLFELFDSLVDLGPIFKTRGLLGKVIIGINDASVAKRVLSEPEDLMPFALFVIPSGETWKKHRKLLQPGFGPVHLNHTVRVAVESTKPLIESMKQGKTVNVYEMSNAFALDVIGQVAFGHDFKAVLSFVNGKSSDGEKKMSDMTHRFGLPQLLWSWVNVPKDGKKCTDVKEYFEQVMFPVMRERKEAIRKGTVDQKDWGMDVLQRLLIAEESLTTANSVTSIAYELSQHPEIQEKMFREIESVLKPGVDINMETLGQMKYVEAVIKEGLRVHSVVAALPRVIVKDTRVNVFIALLHKNPLYWDEPEKFNPDRWEKQPVPGSYMPFGDGPMNCIGQKMAMIEMKVILIQLVRQFKMTLVPDQKINFLSAITYGLKEGLLVHLSITDVEQVTLRWSLDDWKRDFPLVRQGNSFETRLYALKDGQKVEYKYVLWKEGKIFFPMDVLRSNFEQQLPSILKEIQKSEYVAMDLEFTGIGDQGKAELLDSLQDRYDRVKFTATNFIPTQVGLCCFQKAEDGYRAKAYNFYIFPKTNKYVGEYDFLSQATSLNFLAENKFDFNKWIYEGIPWLNRTNEREAKAKLLSRDLDQEMTLDEKAHTYLAEVYQKIDQWLQLGGEKCLILKIGNPYHKRLVHQEVRKKYNGFVATKSRTGSNKMEVSRLTSEQREEHMAKTASAIIEKEIDDLVGFRKILDAVSESKIPIIGHNCYLDLAFLVQHFYQPLPKTVLEFKTVVHDIFPAVYDSKYVAHGFPELTLVVSSTLDETAEDAFHEAGFDSYVTGFCFLRMIDYTVHDAINAPNTSNIFVMTGFPQDWKTKDVISQFKEVGYVNVKWVNDQMCYIIVRDPAKIEIAEQLCSKPELPFGLRPYTTRWEPITDTQQERQEWKQKVFEPAAPKPQTPAAIDETVQDALLVDETVKDEVKVKQSATQLPKMRKEQDRKRKGVHIRFEDPPESKKQKRECVIQ